MRIMAILYTYNSMDIKIIPELIMKYICVSLSDCMYL
jgi:hypothetical protein